MNLSPETLFDIKRDAINRFPQEACGYVKDGKYFSEPNISENPEFDFKMRSDLLVSVPDIQAIIHSHPNGKLHHHKLVTYPSSEDMEHQISSNLTWGIVWTDGKVAHAPLFFGDNEPIKSLLGREFIHGIYDCYSLVRDYFRTTKSVTLMDFPRSFCWWEKKTNNEDLYLLNFRKAGFETISFDELQIGDCFLARIGRTQTTNHAGIYVGNNLILHHLVGRLSCKEPLLNYQKYITHFVRYMG